MNISKKTKTILTSTVSILAATSVVAPLSTMTSCSNKTSEVESQFDKEYGVTEETYNDLKDQFVIQYETRLRNEGKGEQEVKVRSDYLKKQLSSLDKMKDQRKNGFTSLTSAMMDFAKKDTHDLDGNPYGINLSRKSKATWSQIDGLFNSWKGSFRQYMLNSDMPASTITRVMQDAQNKFNSLKKELQQTCNDALDGIIQAKSRIISCFEDVNDEIAFISATMQLKEFLSQYTFTPKASFENQESCLDRLIDEKNPSVPDFKIGNILCDDTMNKVFNITRKDDGTDVTFTNTIIKGYTISPKLTKITFNKFSNLYTFSMDFGLVKTSYIDKYSKDKLDNVTAHTYIADNLDSSDINDKTSLDELIKKCAIKTIDYPIYLTIDAEKDALKETYFNENSEFGHISFNWDDKNADNQAYESFFDNSKKQTDGTWKSDLTFNSLSNSYIRISHQDSSSSYKMINDLSEDFTSRTGKDLHANNLSEQFLADCEISANASIDERDVNNKVVTFDGFYANYNNSIYKDIDQGKLNLNDVNYGAYQKKCVNHAVSKSFFEKVNLKFNNVVAYVSCYDATILNTVSKKSNETKEEYLEKVLETGNEQKIYATVALVACSIAITAAALKAWSPWSGGNSKKITIVSLVFLFVCLALQAAVFTMFMELYYKELVKFVDDARDTKEELEDTTIMKYLKEIASNYEIFEEDGSYDEASFEQKREKFNKHDMSWMLEEYKNYSNFDSIEWKNFEDILEKHDADSETYKTKFEDWKVGGKYWLITLGLNLFMLLASIGLGVWIKKQKAAVTDPEQVSADKELAEDENETVEDNFDLDNRMEESFKNFAKEKYGNRGSWFANPHSPGEIGIYVYTVWIHVVLEFQKEIYNDELPENDPRFHDRLKEVKDDFNERRVVCSDFDWDLETFKRELSVWIFY